MRVVTNIVNWIAGADVAPRASEWIDKFDPHDGSLLYHVADSSEVDVELSIAAADHAFPAWAELTAVKRGQILADVVAAMKRDAAMTLSAAANTALRCSRAFSFFGAAVMSTPW